jgi:hypothetical protein
MDPNLQLGEMMHNSIYKQIDSHSTLSEMNKKGIKRKNTILFAAIDLEEYGMRCINIFIMAVLWESICL